MAEFDALDKDFFSELTFFTPPDEELGDLPEATKEELDLIEEELRHWEKLISSPLGKAVKSMIRSEKAKAVATVMASVSVLSKEFPPGVIEMLKSEAVGAYQVWDYLEKRPIELLQRKAFLEEKGSKVKKVQRRKKTLTKSKKMR